MTDIRREILGTRLGEIEAAIAGEGPPVLALHGGMGGYDQGLILARATFTAPARIVAVSRPGYLGTPLADARTPDAQADLYAAALDTLGIAQAHVVAVSAGDRRLWRLRAAIRHAVPASSLFRAAPGGSKFHRKSASACR